MNDKIKCIVYKLCEHIKKKAYLFFVVTLIILFTIPILIWLMYFIGDIWIGIPTSITSGELLGFYGSFLSFIGTITLGVVAIWQNVKLHNLTEKSIKIDDYSNYPQISHFINNNYNLKYVKGKDYSYNFYLKNSGESIVRKLKICEIELVYEDYFEKIDFVIEAYNVFSHISNFIPSKNSLFFPGRTTFNRQLIINKKYINKGIIFIRFTYSAETVERYDIIETLKINLKTKKFSIETIRQ